MHGVTSKRICRRFYSVGLVLMLLSNPGFSAVDKVTSSTPLLLKTPSSAIPEELLLDVGIPTLNDGLYLTDENDTVFPEVRFAEAIYFANQLAKVMEKSGAWGAIRVTPNDQVITDVYITGTILHSDGETLELSVVVKDTKGQKWFSKTYKKVVGKLAYDRKSRNNLGDPFQNLFISIANDLLIYREKLASKELIELRSVSELRFAKQFSSDAFSDYMSENKKGILNLERLPAEDDELLKRVQKIRQRDYLYIDTMQDYYDGFSQQMHFAYQEFRQSSYDSVVKARQLNTTRESAYYCRYWLYFSGYLWAHSSRFQNRRRCKYSDCSSWWIYFKVRFRKEAKVCRI